MPTLIDLIPRRFIVFGLVGTAGYLIDVAVLESMSWTGSSPYSAQAVAFFVAATATWYLNRTFTFGDRKNDRHGFKQWLIYLTTMVVGFAINYGVYATLILQGGLWRDHLYLAVAVGTLAGLCFNFPASKYFVFRASPILPAARADIPD